MGKTVFITGTGTGVGKTVVAGLLLNYFRSKGINAITQKWVQTGSYENSFDVDAHLGFLDGRGDCFSEYYKDMTPYVFKFAASPHLAADMESKEVDPYRIKTSLGRLTANFDIVFCEGSGGIMVPLNKKTLMVNLAEEINIPTILVSENKLGTINHTLLSIEALTSRNIEVLGIVFNCTSATEERSIREDNKKIIERLSGVSVLGELPYSEDINVLKQAASYVSDEIYKKIYKL